ncbi:hypothetical protein M405DRAFT_808790 [Rhizopogon salebrosus TDB-379]|nr:hypothetical protein M405DRAFT_808790 [Rhizopogon salebrosus TDB-379]
MLKDASRSPYIVGEHVIASSSLGYRSLFTDPLTPRHPSRFRNAPRVFPRSSMGLPSICTTT